MTNLPRKIWVVEDTHYDGPALFWNYENAEKQFLEDTRSGLNTLTEFLRAVKHRDDELLDPYFFEGTYYSEPGEEFRVSVDDGPRIYQQAVE